MGRLHSCAYNTIGFLFRNGDPHLQFRRRVDSVYESPTYIVYGAIFSLPSNISGFWDIIRNTLNVRNGEIGAVNRFI